MNPAGRFRQVYIEITNACNLACAFCPGTARRIGFMAPETFEAILRQVQPLTSQIYLHVMGEPLLHPEFARIVSLAAARGAPVAVTTNGTLIDTPAGSVLLEPGVRQVNFSLQSLREGPDASGRFDRIMAFANRARQERPDLYLNLRLWNLDTAPDIPDTIRRIAAALDLDDPTPRFLPWRKSTVLTGRIYLNCDHSFAWPTTDTAVPEKSRGYCRALSAHCAILVDGTVVPCCLDGEGVTVLGNCLETPLEEILAGPRAAAMRRGFERGELVEALCRRCGFCSRFDGRAKRVSDSDRARRNGHRRAHDQSIG